MLTFQQCPDTFHVEESLFYEPIGEGDYVFTKIRKRGMSTRAAKQRLSEMTGVPMNQFRHAGLKDTAATATQWLSWEARFQRNEAHDIEDLTLLETTRHTNNLSVGHVYKNRFNLRFDTDAPQDFPSDDVLGQAFPNFYGPQRFGQVQYSRSSIRESLDRPKSQRRREVLSSLQGWLFNDYFRGRLQNHGREPLEDELWTSNNGKQQFKAPYDEELQGRYERGEVSPTGPVFGYKTKITADEQTYLASLGMDSQAFRPWGKSAKGSRRILWVMPEINAVRKEGNAVWLDFKLPSGAYATVYMMHLFLPEKLLQATGEQPNFTQCVTLR